MEIVYERVAGIDVGKKEVAVTVRVPGQTPRSRAQQTRKFRTFYPVLRQMVDWLVDQGVTHVAMEATGCTGSPGPQDRRERQRMAGPVARVRPAARQFHPAQGDRRDPGADPLPQEDHPGPHPGTATVVKVLEDAGIKIDSVASSISTRSARDMIEVLIAGQRDPRVLAGLARGRMRTKIPDLTMACSGRFADHHALLAGMHLDHIDHLTSMIDGLDERIEQVLTPFAPQLQLLRTIPGIGERAAQVLISELGVDMSRFPSAAHLASWAGLCPGNNESAGRHLSGRTRKGNAEVRDILTECAWAAGKTGSYLGARFHRLHRRFGKKGGGKAAIAVAHTLIVIVWHVLHDQSEYRELGHDYFTRRDNPEAAKRRLIHNLEALGYHVELTATA